MTTSRFLVLAVALQVIIATITTPCLSDPDALQDFCVADLQAAPTLNGFPCKAPSSVVADDFYKNTTEAFSVKSFPGLNTLGLAITSLNLSVGELNPPHSHPRASELTLVLKGKVLAGFTTSSNQLFSKVVREGELFIVPRGLMHFQLNVDDGDSVFVAIFNSQSPGIDRTASSLFASDPPIPNEVLTKAFLMHESEVDDIKSRFAKMFP